ncbi:MAG TPA: TonB-dependent receptor [Polyangia bacterium]
MNLPALLLSVTLVAPVSANPPETPPPTEAPHVELPVPDAPPGNPPGPDGNPAATAAPATEPAPAPDPASDVAPAAAPAAPGRLTGVVESPTGQPFEDVIVLVDGDTAGSTDAQGRFHLPRLRPGPHLITLIGPQGQDLHEQIEVAPGASLDRRFRLTTRDVETVAITQKSDRPKREAGEVVLAQKDVAAVPGTFGDPVRVIENLPGTSRAPGGLGGALIVRGANPADSAVLMDGVQIPLLYHFGGLTSVVNSEFLSAVTFLPGGFGAQYGRATAGIAEIQSSALSCDRVRASASVDLLDAELFGCTPVGRWRIAAASRRSYIDTFLPAILRGAADEGESPIVVTPAYFDYQLKAETARTNQRFEIFAFGSRDALKLSRATSAEDVDMNLGGTTTFHRLQLRHFYFSDRFTLESSLVPGLMKVAFTESSQELATDHHSGATINTVQWRETAGLRLHPRVLWRAGIDHVLTRWSSAFVTELSNLGRRYPSPLEDDERTQNHWTDSDTDLDQAYWTEVVLGNRESLTVTPGVRLANLVFGRTHRFVIEPRLAARFQASEATAFTAAGGIYRKLPDMMSGVMVDGFGQPNLAAERALHLVWGIEQAFDIARLGRLDTKAEGFYVRRDLMPSPTDEVIVRDGRAEPTLFKSDGRGRAYGVELMLRLPSEQRRFSGWVAYTLSRSLREDRMGAVGGFDQYAPLSPDVPREGGLSAGNHEYLSPFDQTHILTTVGRWELPWNMSLGFRFQLVSGNPTTPLERGEAYYDADNDRYQIRPGSVAAGSARLPTFHKLDVRLDKRWRWDSWQLTAYLEVLNAYNHRPIEAVSHDYRYRTRSELKGLPILPLLGLKGEI